jgi:hypothetical protein
LLAVCGQLEQGQRAAVMSLIQSAKLNGHDPFAYIKDVLTLLPTHSQTGICGCSSADDTFQF